MKVCTIVNKTDGKESELHKKFLDVFKNQKEADFFYAKVMGNDFKTLFGDWEGNYNGTSEEKTGATLPNGEPELFNIPGTTQYYFKLLDGTHFVVNKKGLRGSFKPKEIKEISKYLLFNFVEQGGIDSFNKIESEKDESKLMKTIEQSIKEYKLQLTGLPEGSRARIGLTKRIEKVELFKEDFKNELIVNLNALGQKYLETMIDDSGDVKGEVVESKKGGGINIAESMTVDPKSTATINTKIFLSQLISKKLNPKTGKKENVRGGYLRTVVFEDFDEVWQVLQPMLSDNVASQTNAGVVSTYKKMRAVVESLKDVKPWAEDLGNKLDVMYSDNVGGRYKAYEFVQAFNKTKLNYYVTEFNAETSGYTIYNATATNSRESQILERWGIRFQNEYLQDGKQAYLEQSGVRKIADIAERSRNTFLEFKELLQLAGNDRNLTNQAYQLATSELFRQLRELGIYGMKDTDMNSLIMLGGGTENELKTITDLFESVQQLINGSMLMVDTEGNGTRFTDDQGNGINPFRSQKLIKMLAQSQALREIDISDSSILANGGKSFFAYSNPTYISNKIAEWKQDPSELNELAKMPINGHSRWIKYLLASHIKNNEIERNTESMKRLDKLEYGLANSFTSVGKNDGVDNTAISLNDQISDNLSKLLAGRFTKGASMFPTIIAADKSRRVEFKGFEFIDTRIHERNGEVMIPPAIVDIFVDYFSDEYNRMIQVAREIDTLDGDQQAVHYHTGNTNGLKSQLFPELSTGGKNKEIENILYKDGKPIDYKNSQGLADVQREALSEVIRESIKQRLEETKVKLVDMQDTNKIEARILNHYKKEGGDYAMAGDYLINGLVSAIEYTKLFSGDPAYYKNNADLIKRIPATYTDGLQLALESKEDMNFNMAVVEGVEVASQYQKKIYDSLTDKTIAKAYGKYKDGTGSNVNTTDAQAWISPRRWKFLKKRLGQWSLKHDSVFAKMESGTILEDDELKIAAQPLKGVYFEINKGVPTYLKYSQAVLIPSMVKGTPMDRLLYKMTHDSLGNPLSVLDEVHEVITIDGVKVGAIAPTKINEGNTTALAKEFELNSKQMSNRGWKLQQDLPIKTMHETSLGSQIQKNILEGLDLDGKYDVFGEGEVGGSVMLQKIHDSISDLINIGADEVKVKLGINADDKITDPESLYNVIISEFRQRGGNENIITALEKRTPFDGIPQIRGRIDSILMSVFNRAITKIGTEGGSFIQVSPFGIEQFDSTSGIIKISDSYDDKGLQPPIKGPNGRTLPGQVLIPHTLAIKLLRKSGEKLENMSAAKWKKAFSNVKTRELVGYRIPNQGMSSNDTLEIVGILPETMGDSIVGYDGIPAKTGSDFDIDKMYVMAPNLMYNKKDKTFEIINEANKQFYKGKGNITKLIAQNKVVSLYTDILQSPLTYDNMMTSIDGEFLKDDIAGNPKKNIKGLFPAPIYNNLELFSPLTQLNTKLNYMSGKMGVGLTANQLVDHVANQSLTISLKGDMGMGNVQTMGRKSLTLMDRKVEGTSIAHTLSAFLNAYVDIAKDPYITRGNHNDVTANVSFMLIRAGVKMKTLNRYIGQPILQELVQLKKRSETITGNPLTITLPNGETRIVGPYEFLRSKYKIEQNPKSRFKMKGISDKLLESRINGAEDKLLDSIILNTFEFHEAKAAQFTDAVLAAKVDTNGAGGSPIEMNIAINKIDKIQAVGFVQGFRTKFHKTALGTYEKQALFFTRDVLENSNIVLSGTRGARDTMDVISSSFTRDGAMVNDKFGKATERAMYAYMMSDSKIMKSNRGNFNFLFEKFPEQIIEMQKNSDNFLIKELEVQKRGNYNFIGINGKNKPELYQNNIYRAWMDLYENEDTKHIAVNLVRYSYSQSGFNANLNQFFTHIPHEILSDEGVNFEMNSFYDKINELEFDNNFKEQFARHEADNTDVIKRISAQDIEPGENNNLAFFAKESFEEKFQSYMYGKAFTNYPDFISAPVGDEMGLYQFKGVYAVSGNGEISLPLYARTFKLGYKAGKNKVFEYAYNTDVNKSVVPENEFDEGFAKLVDTQVKKMATDVRDDYDISIQAELELANSIKNNNESIQTGEEQSADEEANSVSLDLSMMKKLNITKKNC